MKTYIDKHKQRFLDELMTLLRMPSISADSAYQEDVLKTADAVAAFLTAAGANNVDVCETPGYPVVYGDYHVNDALPTVLVYGHYDVQPADPLDLWDSEPFSPVVKVTDIHPDGAVFARGACDDKGQFFMHLKAFEAMVATDNTPCNMKFMIEGEEEVGSSNLAWFVQQNHQRLSCDVVVISDTGMIAPGVPSITTGLRGLSYVEVEVTGPNRDLHSGLYGGAVANPINALADMISQLHDKDRQVTIPGFYDRVETMLQKERDRLAKAPFTLDAYKQSLDLNGIQGEKSYSTMERTGIRPALDVNGIWGGYTGEGAKTVIASKAYAKISMRLVGEQDHEAITKAFTAYFMSLAPEGIKVKISPFHGGQPYVCPTDHPGYLAAEKALKVVYGIDALPVRSGGSIPIVALFEAELGVKSILLGFGLDSDAIHSPNEHYGLRNFYDGIRTIPLFYQFYAEGATS